MKNIITAFVIFGSYILTEWNWILYVYGLMSIFTSLFLIFVLYNLRYSEEFYETHKANIAKVNVSFKDFFIVILRSAFTFAFFYHYGFVVLLCLEIISAALSFMMLSVLRELSTKK